MEKDNQGSAEEKQVYKKVRKFLKSQDDNYLNQAQEVPLFIVVDHLERYDALLKSEFKQQLKHSWEEKEALTKKIEGLYSAFEKSLGDSRDQYYTLKEEFYAVSEIRMRLREENESLIKKIASLKDEVEMLMNILAIRPESLADENTILEHEKRVLQEENAALNEEIKRLQSHLNWG